MDAYWADLDGAVWRLAVFLLAVVLAFALLTHRGLRAAADRALDDPAGTPQPTRRARPPLRGALVIGMCLALQATAIVSRAELWPFSPYAMYDELVSNDVRWVRLAAVTDQGEIEIRSDATTLPFGSARLALALEPIFTRGDSIDVQRALGSVAALIERALRDDASNARVLLRALRLYRVEWTVDRKLRNVRRPDRVTLLAEFVVAR